ncbi:hypothetical protein [Viridibacillus arvi]|uniref:hypothetical protein n=1 Tax=Viridibacillus arvi TaxID=263475 RepID=UPI0034CD707D
MAEIQPMLTRIAPFDALKGTSIYFTYFGSKQAIENNLRIKDKSTGLVVYDFNYTGFEKVHHLPPNVIGNGKVYIAKIRVKYLDGTYSPYSNEVEFTTVKTPVLDIENIDGQGYVYNSDITFIARYSQSDGEMVRTYRFHLYDEKEDLIQSFPLRSPTDGAGIVLTETVTKLEKGKGYFIECVVETVNGFTWSQKEKFIPLYIVPSINGVIQTRNDSDEGFVRITANLKQLLGTQVRATDPNDTYISDNYEYENEEWVIVPSDNPIVFKGMGMNRASDFVMKVWCKNVPIGSQFLELSPQQGQGIPIKFWRYADRVLAVKEYSGIMSRHTSNVVNIPKSGEFMLYARVIEHRIELTLTVL